jgi:hypothetical protein
MNLADKSTTRADRAQRLAVAAALFAALLLGGCDNNNNQLLSALQGLGPGPNANETAAAAPQDGIKPIAPAPPIVQNTGTAIGARAMTIHADLQRLSDSLDRHNTAFHRTDDAYAADARAYAETVRAIETHLKGGSAPGNPALVAQQAQARRQLDRVAQDVAETNAVASEIAGDVALAAYVEQEMKSAAAFEAAPGDRRQLASLRISAESDRAVAGQLSAAVNAELAHRTVSLADERRHLGMLDTAVRTGHATVPVRPASASTARRASASATGHSQRPLVIIRFDRPDVPYQQVLYTAVKRALERRPNATFDLVAVSPNRDDEAQLKTVTNRAERDAEDVFHTLSSMGLPPERVRMSAMTSSEVATNEVQIFVR